MAVIHDHVRILKIKIVFRKHIPVIVPANAQRMILHNRLGNFQVRQPHGCRRIFRNMPEGIQPLPHGRAGQGCPGQGNACQIQDSPSVKKQDKSQDLRGHGNPKPPGKRKYLTSQDQQKEAEHPPPFPRIFIHAYISHYIGRHDTQIAGKNVGVLPGGIDPVPQEGVSLPVHPQGVGSPAEIMLYYPRQDGSHGNPAQDTQQAHHKRLSGKNLPKGQPFYVRKRFRERVLPRKGMPETGNQPGDGRVLADDVYIIKGTGEFFGNQRVV